MIRTDELMLGNWVNYETGRKEKPTITGIVTTIFDNSIFLDGAIDLMQEDIFGIPITEELLEKCGFEHKEDCIWIKERVVFHFFPGDMYIFFLCQRIENVEFLHELQNAYYMLTKKYLSVEL